jgi:large subunit ribosomal protein L22
MKVTAKIKNLRTSPRKVRLVANFIKGMDVAVAIVQLNHTVKKTSPDIEKLLKSAVANAENNFGLDRTNLFVKEVIVGDGPSLKRWLPRAHGRATQLLKRSCNVEITLEERVEGKNRKSKQELDKQKKDREEAKAKMLEEFEKERKREEKEAEEKGEKSEKAPELGAGEKAPIKMRGEMKKTPDKGFLKKVFNRKSM